MAIKFVRVKQIRGDHRIKCRRCEIEAGAMQNLPVKFSVMRAKRWSVAGKHWIQQFSKSHYCYLGASDHFGVMTDWNIHGVARRAGKCNPDQRTLNRVG